MITRRQFLWSAALGAVALSPVGAWEYATRIEPDWLRFTRQKLAIAGLPAALEGALLAHLSDIHVGPEVDDAYVLDTFAKVAAIKPAIVAYTGDFVTYYHGYAAQAARVYERLPRGSRATLGVLGNHDYGPEWSHPEIGAELAGILHERGLTVLGNEIAEVDGLQVVGLDDLWAGRFDIAAGLSKLDAEKPMLALSHNPDSVDLPGWGAFHGWVLSGHTHGGQVKLPFLPPPRLPLKDRRYSAGPFQLSGGRAMYVNRGVGHITKVRFGVRPEVALFELTRAAG